MPDEITQCRLRSKIFSHTRILRRNSGLNDDFCDDVKSSVSKGKLVRCKSTRQMHARYLYDRKIDDIVLQVVRIGDVTITLRYNAERFSRSRRLLALYLRRLRTVTIHKKITWCSRIVAPENSFRNDDYTPAFRES